MPLRVQAGSGCISTCCCADGYRNEDDGSCNTGGGRCVGASSYTEAVYGYNRGLFVQGCDSDAERVAEHTAWRYTPYSAPYFSESHAKSNRGPTYVNKGAQPACCSVPSNDDLASQACASITCEGQTIAPSEAGNCCNVILSTPSQ